MFYRHPVLIKNHKGYQKGYQIICTDHIEWYDRLQRNFHETFAVFKNKFGIRFYFLSQYMFDYFK